MERTRAWRRAQRQRMMAKRRRFIRKFWNGDLSSRQYFLGRPPGLYAKRKVLDCSCWMCQHGTRRPEIIEPLDAPYVNDPAA